MLHPRRHHKRLEYIQSKTLETYCWPQGGYSRTAIPQSLQEHTIEGVLDCLEYILRILDYVKMNISFPQAEGFMDTFFSFICIGSGREIVARLERVSVTDVDSLGNVISEVGLRICDGFIIAAPAEQLPKSDWKEKQSDIARDVRVAFLQHPAFAESLLFCHLLVRTDELRDCFVNSGSVLQVPDAAVVLNSAAHHGAILDKIGRVKTNAIEETCIYFTNGS